MLHVAVRQFPRSSGGGLVVNSAIIGQLQQRDDLQLTTFVDSKDLDARAKLIVCMGTSVVRSHGMRTILWPLNVSMFDKLAVRVSSTTPSNWLRYRLLRFKVGRAVRQADALIFDSQFACSEHRRYFPSIVAKPTLTMRPGIQPPDAMKMGPTDAQVPGRVVMVSHLYPYKMIVEAISGFQLVADSIPGAHLLIAGNCPDKKYEQVVRQAIGQQDNIRLLGNLDAEGLSRLYSSSQAVLFCSLTENAGSFTLFDAIHFGRAVICSNRSSMPEAMQESVLFVDPTSTEQISDALGQVLKNPELRKDFEARALERAGRLQTWEERAEQVAQFLLELDAKWR